MANSNANTATAIASGQKLSFGVLCRTGLHYRMLKPVPVRPRAYVALP